MTSAALHLRRVDPDAAARVVTDAVDRELPEEGEGDVRCAACAAVVTHDDHRIAVDGGHVQERTNPYGLRFEFGCFARAAGVETHGSPTTEDTWFVRHAWTLATCAACATHLGWAFDGSDPERFYALILDRLEAGL